MPVSLSAPVYPTFAAANPDGATCYRAAIRLETAVSLDPQEVHELGLAELARAAASSGARLARSSRSTGTTGRGGDKDR